MEAQSFDNFELLEYFARHVPNTLLRQLILHLTDEYYSVDIDNTIDISTSTTSLLRVQGAILFVDISGFTLLSQNLPVDDLRLHINKYFKKILNIVDLHQGDVLKFAGDALFILFKVDISGKGTISDIIDANKASAEKAFKCALEICSQCSNYRINFTHSDKFSYGVKSVVKCEEEKFSDHVYLNVHAGLSMGQLASVTIGTENRAEHFIVGDTISEVAKAESDAASGEVVVSEGIHAILCGSIVKDGSNLLQCGCQLTASGSLKMSKEVSERFVSDIPPILNNFSFDLEDEELEFERVLQFFNSVVSDCKVAFEAYNRKAIELHIKSGIEEPFDVDIAFNKYLDSINKSLLRHVAKYVHEAHRVTYALKDQSSVGQISHENSGSSTLAKSSSKVLSVIPEKPSPELNDTIDELAAESEDGPTTVMSSSAKDSGDSRFVRKIKGLRKSMLKVNHRGEEGKILRQSGAITGELRNVITMFIKIIPAAEYFKFNMCQSFTESKACQILQEFGFFQESTEKIKDDNLLLRRYQECLECILNVLHDKGGQLRQFIVDDKGTICIGTFGLRGAANYDNAASSIQAASSILSRLKDINVDASIGLSLGSAYCGIVGAPHRHEYAIMGASVNLSARLMSKAAIGQIICDNHIRTNDRLHKFLALGTINAKGFPKPIEIFSPDFRKQSFAASRSNFNNSSRSKNGFRSLFGLDNNEDSGGVERVHTLEDILIGNEGEADTEDWDEGAKEQVFGRDEETLGVVEKILSPLKEDAGRFRYDEPMRTVMFYGPSGIGKSAILQAIKQNFRSLVSSSFANIRLLDAKANSFNRFTPYDTVKAIIVEVLFEAWILKEEFEGRGTQERILREEDNDNYTEELTAGAYFLSQFISQELQALVPLLSSVGIVESVLNNDKTKSMSAEQKLMGVCGLLVALLTVFVEKTESLLCLVIDDCQYLDRFSVQILHRLISSKAKGVIFFGAIGDTDLIRCKDSIDSWLIDPERCMKFPVERLPFASVVSMVQGELKDLNIPCKHDYIYDMVDKASGGNPLYIRELAKAIVEKIRGLMEDNKMGHLQEKDYDCSVLKKTMNEFHMQRVEEMICFRFDKLDAKSQTVLKIASIASAASVGFTLKSLVTIACSVSSDALDVGAILDHPHQFHHLKGNGDDDKVSKERAYENAISTILLSIVNSGDFVSASRLSDAAGKGTPLSSQANTPRRGPSTPMASKLRSRLQRAGSRFEELSPDAKHFKECIFYFKVALERSTLYNLLLKDQREPLHLQMAHILDAENKQKLASSALQPMDLSQEGFHWDRAGKWALAMSCYFRTATMFDELGAFTESYNYLIQGYNMINHLKSEAGFSKRSLELVHHSSILEAVKKRSRRKAKDAERRKLQYFTMFHTPELLEIAMNILLKYAQASFTFDEDIKLTLYIYTEALNLIFDTWRDSSASSAPCSDGEDAAPETERGTSEGVVETLNPLLKDFGLKNPASVFPVFAGIAALYRTRRLQDDESHSVESALYGLIVELASTSDEYYIHRMQGMCLRRALFSDTMKYAEADAMTDSVREVYQPSVYSAGLIKAYGNDRVPFTFAFNVQLLLLTGRLTKAKGYISHLSGLVFDITHLQSLAMAAIVVMKPLVGMTRDAEAEAIGQKLFDMAADKARYPFNIFGEIFPLLSECFRLSKAAEREKREKTQVQEKIISKGFLLKDKSKPPLLHDVMASLGCSIQFLCAKVLLMKAIEVVGPREWGSVSSEEATAVEGLLNLALEYLSDAAIFKGARFVYSQASSLLLEARILSRLYSLPGKSVVASKLQQLLRECFEIAVSYGFIYVTLAVAKAAEDILSISSEESDALLSEFAESNERLIGMKYPSSEGGDSVAEMKEIVCVLMDVRERPWGTI